MTFECHVSLLFEGTMFCTTFQLATSGRPVSPDASDVTACRAPCLGGEFCGHGRLLVSRTVNGTWIRLVSRLLIIEDDTPYTIHRF